MTRIMTYNVHRCVGTDRRLDVGRIAAVIAQHEPDIVALQEVDVGRARTRGVDQAREIADRLGMISRFHPALKVEEELYGDAILTDLPERLIKAGPLPGYPRLPGLEPRGALLVGVTVGGVEIEVLNAHLGLVPREQQLQAQALKGPLWLGDPARLAPKLVVGDFNCGPRSAAGRILKAGLADARAAVRGRVPTFPSAMPVRRLDHVFVSLEIRVTAIFAASDPLTRLASDHLPLVVDFEVAAVA
jgi:endonuclease/exonuclease/phosphatase family metal-dependent hydrolase